MLIPYIPCFKEFKKSSIGTLLRLNLEEIEGFIFKNSTIMMKIIIVIEDGGLHEN